MVVSTVNLMNNVNIFNNVNYKMYPQCNYSASNCKEGLTNLQSTIGALALSYIILNNTTQCSKNKAINL
jgi:hypothetical protein